VCVYPLPQYARAQERSRVVPGTRTPTHLSTRRISHTYTHSVSHNHNLSLRRTLTCFAYFVGSFLFLMCVTCVLIHTAPPRCMCVARAYGSQRVLHVRCLTHVLSTTLVPWTSLVFRTFSALDVHSILNVLLNMLNVLEV